MNKEQIQQKFDEILKKLNWIFYPDEGNQPKYFYRNKGDLLDLMESCFNLGLEVAADNAEADINLVSEDDRANFERLTEGIDYEVYVLKNSILQFKI